MTTQIDKLLGVHQTALGLRAQRSEVLASNIANADTPGYAARDVDFRAAMARALGEADARAPLPMARTSAGHMDAGPVGNGANGTALLWRSVSQASIDNNTVDVNVERAQFADNAMRYEASLTFLNAKIKSLLSAIQS